MADQLNPIQKIATILNSDANSSPATDKEVKELELGVVEHLLSDSEKMANVMLLIAKVLFRLHEQGKQLADVKETLESEIAMCKSYESQEGCSWQDVLQDIRENLEEVLEATK